MAVILEEQKKVENRRSLDRNDLVIIENQTLKRENQGIRVLRGVEKLCGTQNKISKS